MSAGDDYNISGGRATADVEGAAKGEFFWGDAEDFYWVASGDGDCGVGGAGVNSDAFWVWDCLLDDAAEEAANVLFFVVTADD